MMKNSWHHGLDVNSDVATSPLAVPVSIAHSKGAEQLPSSQPCSKDMGFAMENLHFFPCLSGALFHLHCHGFLLHLSSSFFLPPSPLSSISLLTKKNPSQIITILEHLMKLSIYFNFLDPRVQMSWYFRNMRYCLQSTFRILCNI